MLAYLTEIISKADWKKEKQYGPKIHSKMDKSFYRKSLGFLKSKIFTSANLSDKRYIFLATNGGKLTNTNIVKYNVDSNDKTLVELINSNTKYKIPESKMASFLTIGKCLNGKTMVNLNIAIAEVELKFNMNSDDQIKQKVNREAALRKKEIELDGETDPAKKEKLSKIVEGIRKRLALEDEKANTMNREKLEEIVEQYKAKQDALLKKGKYVIVLTYDTRAVASQSTKVGWRSCMNLDDGEYNQYVAKSINIGTFIAYLATQKDKNELNEPVGRVLCKAYYGYDNDNANPDVVWVAGAFYPGKDRNKMEWFGDSVQTFLNGNNKPKYRFYNQTSHNYHDTGEPGSIDMVDYGFSESSLIDNRNAKYRSEVKGIKQFAPNSYDDLSEHEQEEVRDIAYEIAMQEFDYMDAFDNRGNRQQFAEDEYENDILDMQREEAESLVDRNEFTGDMTEKEFAGSDKEQEYQDAIDDALNDVDMQDIYDTIAQRHNHAYYQWLIENNSDNVYDYMEIDEYINDAFDEWLDRNY